MSELTQPLPEVLLTATNNYIDQGSYLPLERETRAAVDTDCAAFHLNRRPQTLRCWAAFESGPIRPLRINGRLAWPVAGLRKLLEVE